VAQRKGAGRGGAVCKYANMLVSARESGAHVNAMEHFLKPDTRYEIQYLRDTMRSTPRGLSSSEERNETERSESHRQGVERNK